MAAALTAMCARGADQGLADAVIGQAGTYTATSQAYAVATRATAPHCN